MSETEFKKLRTHLRFLTVAVVVFILLVVASLIHTFIDPKTDSFPQVQGVNGKDGKDAAVDYDAINRYIQAQIAAIPKPVNGTNGQSIVGPQGPPGVGTQGPAGQNGSDGSQGDPGVAKEIELRHNDVKAQTEWRYVGDFGWQVLAKDCTIAGTC